MPGGRWTRDPNHSCRLRFGLLHVLDQTAAADLWAGTAFVGPWLRRLDGWKGVEIFRIDIPVEPIGT